VSDGVAFVVNPASANGSTGRRWPEIARRAAAAGLEGDAFLSTRPGEVAELTAKAASGGAGLVVAVGGDGTVFEAVNGLMRAGAGGEVELAILPRGTGKDFMRTFSIPGSLDRALAIARDGAVRTIDVGHARYTSWDGSPGESWFANFGGAGISGAIARRVDTSSKALGGRVSFFWATTAVFMRWKPSEMTVRVDGEERSGRMLEVLATIGRYAAGGMKVAPDASPDDGLLDALLIGDVNKVDFVLTVPKMYRGTHLKHPKVELLRGKTVAIEAAEALPVTLDGEQPGTTPIVFDVVPKALRLRVPAGS
jgi:YegS/Rv2252/BmrU family lipid kinase